MLALLTDAHISPVVAYQVRALQADIRILSLHEWRGGQLLSVADDRILAAAMSERLSLVTYDQRTIAPLVTRWGTEGRDHAGVVFIDHRSIAQSDVGGLVRGLIALWMSAGEQNWTNVVVFLTPRP